MTVLRLNSSATLLSDPQISHISIVLQPIPYIVTIRFESILISHQLNFMTDYEHPVLQKTETNLCIKGKAIPLQAWTGPEGSRG